MPPKGRSRRSHAAAAADEAGPAPVEGAGQGAGAGPADKGVLPVTESVAKGCFLFPAKAGAPKHDQNGGFFKIFPEEPDSFVELRRGVYESEWTRMQASIESIQGSQHGSVFDELVAFVTRFRASEEQLQRQCSAPLIEVPTALVLTGVNLPDHENAFQLLQTHLRTRLSPFVALLRSRECSGLKGLLTSVMEAFFAQSEPPINIRAHGDIQVLLGWYRALCARNAAATAAAAAEVAAAPPTPSKRGKRGAAAAAAPAPEGAGSEEAAAPPTPSKRGKRGAAAPPAAEGAVSEEAAAPPTPSKRARKGGAPAPAVAAAVAAVTAAAATLSADSAPATAVDAAATPAVDTRPMLVVVLQDFDAFDPTAVADFIAICSAHKAALPFYLVLGVASTPDVLHQRLTRRALACVSTATFRIRNAALMLEDAIRDLLLSESHHIKLGPRPLKHMIDHFRLETSSLHAFARSLKYTLLRHCAQHPLSFLCNPTGVDKHIKALTPVHCELVRAQPSFRAYIEGLLDPAEQRRLLLDDDALRACTARCLEALHAHRATFHAATLALHAAIGAVPTNTGVTILPSALPSLYALVLRKPLSELDGAQSFFRVLRLTFATELAKVFEAAAASLEAWVASRAADEGKALAAGAKKCREWAVSLREIIAAPEEAAAPAPDEDEPAREDSAGWSSAKRRKLLLRGAPRRETRFDVARKEAVGFLESFLCEHLRPPSALPLHELVYVAEPIRDDVEGKPRSVIQAGLATYARYLGPDSTEPDVCIAYRLYLECGTLINLYDWLQAFSAVAGGADGEPDTTVQARFAQAVAELQFMGFVKATRRKTDHMQRLAWSLA
eukprot:m.72881 g.72881  ORF g.72881 m.72881 type:complete len:840 (+) comp7697_c0_seq3:2-2521(+)